MVKKDDIDESYFSQRPTIRKILGTDSGGPSTNASGPPTRKARYRPHTPPFPPITSPQSSKPTIAVDSTKNDILIPKAESGPHLSYRSSYAHLLSRLREDSEREEKQHSDSRSGPRFGSNNLNIILRLLDLETARADAAESQVTRDNEAILTRVRNIREAHVRAQAELVHVNTELAMYKFQLDLAHKEIRHAQVIIDEADKARAEAEERCTEDREKIREFVLQRAIDEAREEGRREGWRLGLERGRWDVWAMQHNRRLYNAEQMVNRKETNSRSPERESLPALSSNSLSRAMPDTRVAPRRPHLSISKRPDSSRQRESTRCSPEHVSLSRSRQSSSSSSKRSRSPSRSETCSSSLAPPRPSVKSHCSVPPDGFIPTLGPDEHIALPPPHEFSVPVEPDDDVFRNADAQTRPTATTSIGGKGIDPQYRSIIRDVSLQTPRQHTHNFWPSILGDHSDYTVSRADQRHGYETPALSVMSKRSTRISEFDIVRPPTVEAPNYHGHLSRAEERNQQSTGFYELRSATNGDIPTEELDNSQKIAEERHLMSVNNLDVVQAVTGKVHENSMVRSPRVTGGSRLPPSASQVSGSNLARRASYIYRTTVQHQGYPSDDVAHMRSAVNIYRQPILPTSGLATSNPERRATVQRSASNVTVPGIDVEPPSYSPTNTSPGTTVNPVLLTPEHANHLTVVPDPLQPPAWIPENSLAKSALVEQLPPGFVPLHPIPAITDSKSSEDDHLKSTKHTHAGHQIASGPLETRYAMASSKLNSMLSGHNSLSLPSTAHHEFSMERSPGLEYSPAPLNRPISLFSDD